MNDKVKEALEKVKNTQKEEEKTEQPEAAQESTYVDPRPDITYCCFITSKPAINFITESGKKVKFTGYRYITADPEIIDYLERQIAAGIRGLTKGDSIISKETDPMEAVRREEALKVLAEQEERARRAVMGETENMGESENFQKFLNSSDVPT